MVIAFNIPDIEKHSHNTKFLVIPAGTYSNLF